MAAAPLVQLLRRAAPVAVACLLGAAAVSLVSAQQPGPAPDWGVEARALRDKQKASLEEYAPMPADPGKYQVPVSRAMDLVIANPSLLKPITVSLSPDATPAERGEIIFNKLQPCYTCHAVSAADTAVKLGPPLHGRWGGPTRFIGGTGVFDEAHVTESIKNPLAKVTEGFPPVMPPLPMTDAQVADVIEYLKALE